MRLLVPREQAPGERRVAATPETVRRLMSKGAILHVQHGAGQAAGFRDDDFLAVGADLLSGEALPWEEVDGVLCVQPPPAANLQRLRQGSLLVGLLSPYGAADLAGTLNDRQASAIALELLPRISRAQSMDVLSSQANIAGYKAVLLAAAALDRYVPMLMTAAGTIQPSRVLVLGAGVAGLQALATAKRLGGVVYVSDVRPGSVVVDLAVAQGGNCFGTVPGTTVERRGVQLIGADALPSSVPNHASALYARNVAALVEHLLADEGLQLDPEDPILDGCLLTHAGVCRREDVIYPNGSPNGGS